MRKIWMAPGAAAAIAIYLVFAPAPIDPVAYEPPPAPPMEGALAPNELLRAAEILGKGRLTGPETVTFDNAGRVCGAGEEGDVLCIDPETGRTVESGTLFSGRALGLVFAPDQHRLLVADPWHGLLAIDFAAGGQHTTVLVHEAGGVRLGFTDDVDVASDGSAYYFSDASTKFGFGNHLYDLLEARPHGRLVRHDPATGATDVLEDGLYFANGVAVAADDSYVLVNETYRFRVRRHWLTGPRAGQSEIFASNLPGYPDGISRSPRGTYWVALFTTRNPRADWLSPRPFAKKTLSRLPRAMWPKPEPYGLVLELDADGTILRSLHDPGGQHVRQITNAEEHDGWLYLGSLANDFIARVRL
jgi:sugar lactone lactonase YvrE